MQTFIIGSQGMVKANTTATFKKGEPVQSRAGQFYYVVEDTFNEHGHGQLAIRYDEHEKKYSATHANPQFGYRSRLADWPIISEEEVRALVDGLTNQRNEENLRTQEKERIRRETLERGKAWLSANKPASAVAVIVAELYENNHDPYADYPSEKRVKSVVLAWSHKDRNDFSELRSAAALYEPTASFAAYDKDKEQREKYSGGGGFYLGDFSYGGWKIKKHSLKYYDAVYELAGKGEEYFLPMKAKPATSAITEGEGNLFASDGNSPGIKVTLNEAKNGVEIKFDSKPDDSVLERLKALRFNWSRKQKIWYAIQSPERIAFANSL